MAKNRLYIHVCMYTLDGENNKTAPGSVACPSAPGLALLAGPARQPGLHGAMPLHRVRRLQNPVVLVGEIEELARDSLPLQGREGRQSLLKRNAKIPGAVDDQHGCPPFGDPVDRVLGLVARGCAKLRPTHLPLRKPELLRSVVHAAVVEHAAVVDQALEGIRPGPGDPVDHVASITRAQCAGPPAVQEGIAVTNRGPAFAQVFQGLAAPVSADAVREGLAVARRAVEIDEHHGIALAGVGLRIPAIVKAVAHAALRPAVDDEGHGIVLALFEAHRLDHPATDRIAVRARKTELLVLAEAQLAKPFGVMPRDLPHAAATIQGEQLCRAGEVFPAKGHRVPRHAETGYRAG